jgi:hypothetical protein
MIKIKALQPFTSSSKFVRLDAATIARNIERLEHAIAIRRRPTISQANRADVRW